MFARAPRAIAEYVTHTFPGMSRVLLGLSAQGYLPRSVYRRFPESITKPLFHEGMRLYSAPYGLYAPFEAIKQWTDFEPISQKTFKNAVKAGMTVLDVGANAGYYTLLAGKLVGPSGKVHAVEPCANNLAFLEKNIKLSRLKNITVHRCAAGEKTRQRIFHVTDRAIDHGFYPHPTTKTVEMIEVSEVRMDELIKSPVHLAKIDVEGAEIEVLNGMTSILSKDDFLALIVEWSPDCLRNAGHDPCELPAHLQRLGFKRLEVLDDRGKQVTSVEEVLQKIRLGQLRKSWWGNLWATRQ